MLVLAGFAVAVGGPWVGAVFALFAALATAVWSRSARLYALLHGAVYLLAAGVASGSLGYSARALVAGMEGPWTVPDLVMLLVFAASALSAGLAAMQPTSGGDEVAIGARFAIIVVCVWVAGGTLVGYLAPLAGGLPDRS